MAHRPWQKALSARIVTLPVFSLIALGGPLGGTPRAAGFTLPPEAIYAIGSAAAVAASTPLDGWAGEEAPENSGPPARFFSRAGDHLGNGAAIGASLLLLDAGGRLFHHPALAASTEHIATSVLVAGAAAGAIKLSVGRARPDQTPGDVDVFRPFSGNTSFPSGHTTVAFAAAAALTRECHARWVKWVAYPAAALVAWSRLRDNRHWASDVVAGAALGYGAAVETERYLHR
jgi:membrane-associated phospholipid phosphatase